jgi:hypothetical protein
MKKQVTTGKNTTRETKKNSAYNGNSYTPLFEGLPAGMSLIDMAVYGEIVRRSKYEDKKFTASALTLATLFHLNEKTIDRSFKSLEEWHMIVCVFRGKNTRDTSHYIPNVNTKEWNVPEKIKRTITRDSKSKTRDSKSSTRVTESHKESIKENLIEMNKGNFSEKKAVKAKKSPKKAIPVVTVEETAHAVAIPDNENKQEEAYSPDVTIPTPRFAAPPPTKKAVTAFDPTQSFHPVMEQFSGLKDFDKRIQAYHRAEREWIDMHSSQSMIAQPA